MSLFLFINKTNVIIKNKYNKKARETERMDIAEIIQSGNVALFKEWIESREIADSLVHKILYSHNYLTYAAMNSRLEIVEFIIESGIIPINKKNHSGRTALMYACMNANEPMMQYLLSKGAYVNAKDISGMSAFLLACQNKNVGVLKLLKYKGANVYEVDGFGKNALIFAASSSNAAVVKYLLEIGIDPTHKDSEGENALIHAIWSRRNDIAKMLMECYGDIDQKNTKGKTLLMHACRYGNMSFMEYLIEQNANVNVRDDEGSTALMQSVQHRFLSAVQMLLAAKADVNICDNKQWTPLMEACKNMERGENGNIVEALLKKRANVTFKNAKGESALTCSCHDARFTFNEARTRMMVKLIEKGADINDLFNLKDNHLLTPLLAKTIQNKESALLAKHLNRWKKIRLKAIYV